MTGSSSVPEADLDDSRIFPMVDRVFLLFVVLELLVYPLLPAAPLAIAGAAMTTRLRRSRWRVRALWILAAVLTVIVIAPFALGVLNVQFVDAGSVHNACS
ncbi:MAG TPA: hypothetical protein VGO65_03810 [Pseudolysinimonas sp.]|nr:hypothetical protein [Pseudolysinimonas sp.]